MGVEQLLLVVIGVLFGWLQALNLKATKVMQEKFDLQLQSINDSVHAICSQKDADHREMWRRIYGHKHTDNGDVVIPKEQA